MNLNTDNQIRNNNFQKNKMNSIIDIKAKNNNNYNHNLFKISKVNNDSLNKNKKENEKIEELQSRIKSLEIELNKVKKN